MLAPAIALLVIVDLGTEPDRRARFSGQAWLLRRAGILAAMLAVALTTLWACYGFRYAARPAGLSLDHTLAQQLAPLPHIEARAVAFLVGLHALPEAWIWGFLDVQRITRSVPSYVLGRFYARGPRFYFPLVLAMKLTLGSLGMLALTLWALATRRLRISRELYFLAMPPALFLLAAVASHLTREGVRHLLPLVALRLHPGSGRPICPHPNSSALDLADGSAPHAARGARSTARLSELLVVLKRALGWTVEDVPLPRGLERGLGPTVEGDPGLSGPAQSRGLLDCVFRRTHRDASLLWDTLQAAPHCGIHRCRRAAPPSPH